jgi:transcriptional regulator with XRE-family HTH domain
MRYYSYVKIPMMPKGVEHSMQQPRANIFVDGERLKALRLERGLKQREVEERARIPYGRLSQFEKNRVTVPPEYLERLLDLFEVSGLEVIPPAEVAELRTTAQRLNRLTAAGLKPVPVS